MIRKLWLDVQPLFVLSLGLLLALTATYSWFFKSASVFEYSGPLEYGIVINPGDDVPGLLKEHPTGRLFSLKNTPDTYFSGFDAMARHFFPFVVVIVCIGGVLMERNNGSASFSLSLPLSRSSWLWQRAVVLFCVVLGMAILDCAAAFAISFWMGVGHSVGWLVTSPLFLALEATPAIGLSLYIQSWISGRLSDTTGEALVAFGVTMIGVILIQGLGHFMAPLTPGMWLFFAYSKQSVGDLWRVLAMTAVFGIGGLAAAIRRFERMDF